MIFINLYSFGLFGFIFFIFCNILIFKFRLKNPFIFTIIIFLLIFFIIIISINKDLEILLSSLIIYFFLCTFYTLFLLGLNNSVSVKLMEKVIYDKEINESMFYNDYVYEKSFKNRIKYLQSNSYIINKNDSLFLSKKSEKILSLYNILVKIFLKNNNTG